jgi:ABC-type oligopeptide transport system substrate-binding subunit
MRGTIKLGVIVVACAAALGVAGCGGDDDETTSSTTTTTEETSATGATGAEGADTEAPEGAAEVQSLLEQAFAAQGLTPSEATCVAELVAPTVADQPIEELQDPAAVEDLLTDQKSEIEECEGK